jgi:hypothetical protein
MWVRVGKYQLFRVILSVGQRILAGNNIEEIIEVYMGDLTGDTVERGFGNEFPLYKAD